MRFRDKQPGDLDKLRAAVPSRREDHPEESSDALVAAVGPAFHLDWAVVLRSVVLAADRQRARRITGAIPGSTDTLR